MHTSSIARSTFNILILTILVFILLPAAYAKKGGGGGGKPGGDPPVVCDDVFPGFVYLKEATKKTPEAIYLASSDGCQEPVPIVEPVRVSSGPIMHVTEKGEVIPDGYSGVVLWTTSDPDNDLILIVNKVNFTIDENGELNVYPTVKILPLDTEIVPPGDALSYRVKDVWGDANHNSLYLAVRRSHSVNNGPISSREARIYNLANLTDSRVLGAECLPADFPQFVPACYGFGYINWNSDGTRLYWSGASNGWYGAVRVDIDKGNGLPVESWIFSEPELIYTGPSDPSADFGAPSGVLVRPPSATSDEFLAMTYLDRTGQNTVGAAAVLNADACVGFYAPFSDGNLWPDDDDLWRDCMVGVPFVGGSQGRQSSWQSSDDLLISRVRRRGATDIYRIHNPGQPDMSEKLLIEGAERADSGF